MVYNTLNSTVEATFYAEIFEIRPIIDSIFSFFLNSGNVDQVYLLYYPNGVDSFSYYLFNLYLATINRMNHSILWSYASQSKKIKTMSIVLSILLFMGIYAVAFSIEQYNTVQAQGQSNNTTNLLLL